MDNDICRWFYGGTMMGSSTHNYHRGECLQCGAKDPDYKKKVGNCPYCGRSVNGGDAVCYMCQSKLNENVNKPTYLQR